LYSLVGNPSRRIVYKNHKRLIIKERIPTT
jgi:hypothetical protein